MYVTFSPPCLNEFQVLLQNVSLQDDFKRENSVCDHSPMSGTHHLSLRVCALTCGEDALRASRTPVLPLQ